MVDGEAVAVRPARLRFMPDMQGYLVEGERLLFQAAGNGVLVAVTTSRLLMLRRGVLRRSTTSVLLSHISSVTLRTSYRMVAAGLLVLLLSMAACYELLADPSLEGRLAAKYGPDAVNAACSLVLLAVLLGLFDAVQGWLNRNTLVVSHSSGRVVLRGGGWVQGVERALLGALAARGPG